MGAPLRSEVAVVGGGPAGLACAIAAASRGLDAIVFDRRASPRDRACGEGILPSGLRALAALGALDLVAPADRSVVRGLAFVDADGARLVAPLPPPHGLTVRRTALVAALEARARALGVRLVDRVEVRGARRAERGVLVDTSAGACEAAVVIAADGRASPLRREAGLDAPRAGPRRFGVRRHLAMRAWSDLVEVWFGDGVECYVTPVGPERVGVAILWDEARVTGRASFDVLLARFPRLAARLAGAPAASSDRGAGPLGSRARAVASDRLVLAGDAAGSVDALTGEGLSLAFEGAIALADVLPRALAEGATARSFAPYARAFRRAFARRVALERALLAIAARPGLRAWVMEALAGRPRVVERVMAMAGV
jgi:flavin-dependent dehydrogenase